MAGPPAAGVRVAWEDVPAPVRSAIEDECGSAVVTARTQPGGFSPGVAARVVCADQARYFVKAASGEVNADTPRLHRQEGEILAALDPLIAARHLPVPRLRAVVERDPWTALILEDVDGRHPAEPWQAGDLARVMAALDQLGEALTPSPITAASVSDKFAADFTGWRTLAQSPGQHDLDSWSRAHLDDLAALEATWPAHAAGDTLLHADVRADNMLLTEDRVVVVDWPHASVSRDVDRQSLAAVVCALAGYFTHRSLQPAPPGLPTVRAFQAAQGVIARRWLAALV